MTRTTVAPQHPGHPRAGVFVGDEIATTPTTEHSRAVASAGASRRHVLGLEGVPASLILELLDAADRCRTRWQSSRAPRPDLQGIEVCNAFFEDSTRTRISFELAERRLAMTLTTFGAMGSSVSKGESMIDTLQTIAAMGVDIVVVRHASSGTATLLARETPVSVINAGDGAHEHPTQGLLDLLTLRDAWGGEFSGRRIAIVGDLAHSRVARSAIAGLRTLGTRVVVAGPATLVPDGIESLGCTLAPSVDDAVEGAHAVMALRLQRERMEQGLLPSIGEYAREWGINARRVARMRPDAVVMHPGPMNRDVEIASDVADGGRSVILRQVSNGVAVRGAVLAYCAGRELA
jgi:aspartate carbamoyltransferase catalytic subunit